MKSSLIFCLTIFFVSALVAQNDAVLALAEPDSIRESRSALPLPDRFMPALPTGDLLTFLYQQLEYPDVAAENGAEGTVVLALHISESGQIVKREVVRSVPLLDQAAITATENLPRLLPAVENGQAVARVLHIPILFRLR